MQEIIDDLKRQILDMCQQSMCTNKQTLKNQGVQTEGRCCMKQTVSAKNRRIRCQKNEVNKGRTTDIKIRTMIFRNSTNSIGWKFTMIIFMSMVLVLRKM